MTILKIAAMALPAFAMLALGHPVSAANGATIQKERSVPPGTAEQAATAFLDAFNSLDTARFDAFFAEDATMFFPNGPFPKARVEGRQAVTAAFGRLFAMAKERGTTRLNIKPVDLKVQDYGNFAIATFHLKGSGNIGRRSILLRQDKMSWRIVHFHASSLEEDK